MRNLTTITLIVTLTLVSQKFYCQTQTYGLPDVIAIENDAATINSNKTKIMILAAQLPALQNNLNARIELMRKQLNDLIAERDNIIADMKVGAKCSQCGKYKSEFEKAGQSFEKHLGEVKGYAIPATTTELESKRKEYIEKIAYKKVQISQLENNGDDNIRSNKKQTEELENELNNLCIDINKHAANYGVAVLNEAKNKHQSMMKNLMNTVSEIFISNDKIAISKYRIEKEKMEFQSKSEEIKTNVKKENLLQIQKLESIIKSGQTKIDSLTIAKNNNSLIYSQKIQPLKQKKDELNTLWHTIGLPDTARIGSKKEFDNLAVQIQNIENSFNTENSNIESQITQFNKQNQECKNSILQLTTNLPNKQTLEIAKVKPIYDKQLEDATNALVTANSNLMKCKVDFSISRSAISKENVAFINVIDKECSRMLFGTQGSSCQVMNDVRSLVTINWSSYDNCANSIANMSRPYILSNINCTANISAYLVSYISFVSGLADEDKQVINK